MLKVNNRKVIRNLSRKSYAAARTRNIIATIAIMLTATLFTALFTIGSGFVETLQRQTMRQSGGDYHGTIKCLTREQYEKLRQDPLIKECADAMLVADRIENEEFLKRHVEAWYYPESYYPHCFFEILDGRAPKAADEILLDEESMRLLGMEPYAGQQVTLQMMVKKSKGIVEDRTFTVAGVIKSDPALNTGFAIVTQAYLDAHAEELVFTFYEDYSLTGTIRMDILFDNSWDIQGKLFQVILNAGYSIDMSDPDYIDSNGNWAYVSDGIDLMTAGSVLGGLCLILLTGYLIIYNIFQISVIRDIRYYGLLKSIGTTGRQIRKIIHRQALRLGLTGLLPGLLIGFFLGKIVVPKFVALSSMSGDEIMVSVKPLIFIGASLFTLLTVRISAGKPARIAAKVSPVEAVRYTEGSRGRNRQKRSTDGGRLWRMALSNFGRSKQKCILVVLSLSLAVVLLNSVVTVTHSFDLDAYLKSFVTSDFLIANAKYFNPMETYRGFSEDQIMEENLSESFIEACEAQNGFLEGGRLYAYGNVGLRKSCWTPTDHFARDADGNLGEYWNGEFYALNEWDADSYLVYLYGMEDFFYKQLEVYAGESDVNVIREKLKSGKYVVCSVETDDGKVMADRMKHQPGDRIILTYGDGQEREFEVLSIIKENVNGMTSRGGWIGNFCYYADAEIFKEMASDKFLMSYGFNAEDEKEADIEAFIRDYTTTTEPIMSYESKMSLMDEFSDMKKLILLVGGVLALIIGIIGILNFINAMLTGMVTRQREFATLEAVGMTRRQLLRMLVLEGVYYAAATVLCSVGLGSLFSVTVLRAMVNGMWFLQYQFRIVPALVAAPILLVLGVLVPMAAFRFEKMESVVERLRATV